MNFWMNAVLRGEPFSEPQAKQKAKRDLQNTDLKVMGAKKHQLHMVWVLSLVVSDCPWPEEVWHYQPYCSSLTHPHIHPVNRTTTTTFSAGVNLSVSGAISV